MFLLLFPFMSFIFITYVSAVYNPLNGSNNQRNGASGKNTADKV